MTPEEIDTKATVEALYQAYFDKNPDGMVDLMSDDVWICFLGRVDFHGKQRARLFFNQNGPLLEDLRFRIKKLIFDGPYAAAIWSETARTFHGDAYANHGVDVFEVRDREIVMVHENNDINVHRSHFGRVE